jgi:hypothetical protein
VQDDAVRAQLGIRDRLGKGDGAGHDDRRVVGARRPAERVQGRDPEARQVRRRRHVREVAGTPRRVEADRPRGEVGLQVAGEVSRRPVVGCDDQRRASAQNLGLLQQGRQGIGPQGARDVGVDLPVAVPPFPEGLREGVEPLAVRRELDDRSQLHGPMLGVEIRRLG